MKKKKLYIHCIMMLAVVLSASFLVSCSKDDDGPTQDTDTFMIDGDRYSVNIASVGVNTVDSERSSASIILTGSNGSRIGTVTFIAHFSTSAGINGTYTAAAGGSVGDPGTYASHLGTYGIQNGSDLRTGGFAVGPVAITSHGDREYTIVFDVKYSDNVEATANIRRTFTRP